MSGAARDAEALSELAPSGRLRIGLNIANAATVSVAPDGGLSGPAPRLIEALTAWTGLPIEVERFGSVVETIAAGEAKGRWDLSFLAADPARADRFHFSRPYLAIEGAAAVWTDSPLAAPEDLDRPGVRIASSNGAAYDLQLRRSLRYAGRIGFEGPEASVLGFQQQRLDAVVGIRQMLEQSFAGRRDIRILPGAVVRILHCLAIPVGRPRAAALLDLFLRDTLGPNEGDPPPAPSGFAA